MTSPGRRGRRRSRRLPAADAGLAAGPAPAVSPPEAASAASNGAAGAAGGGAAGAEEAVGAVGGGAGGGAAPTPAVDTSDPQALLMSVASAPPSQFPAAVAAGRAGSAAAQSAQRASVAASMPTVQAPTGMAPAENPRPAVRAVPKGTEAEPPQPGAREGREPDTEHPEPTVPVPGAQAPPVTVEPAASTDDGGSSWWSWLTSQLSQFFGSLPTTDTGVDTSAGPRPSVDLTGDADPAQDEQAHAAGQESVRSGRGEADTATAEPRGEAGVAPTPRTPRTLQATISPATVAAGSGGAGVSTPAVPADLRAAMDQDGASVLAGETAQHTEAYAAQRAEFRRSSEEAQLEGERRIQEETSATTRQQIQLKQQAQAEIGEERTRWREENSQIPQRRSATRSSRPARRGAGSDPGEGAVHPRRGGGELAEAEHPGRDREGRAAEAEAAVKKKEEENKPRSFWESVKGAIGSVFDAIRSVVRGPSSTRMRALVREIIEAAKSAVHGLIEAARRSRSTA